MARSRTRCRRQTFQTPESNNQTQTFLTPRPGAIGKRSKCQNPTTKPKPSQRRDLHLGSIPLLSLSSCEALLEWSWFVGVLIVESGDRLKFVDISHWLPIRMIESGPLDKVLQSLSIHSRIENGVHKPFLLTINFHQGWRWLSLSRKQILRCGFK